ncbi:MAG: hypothetical protein VB092_05945 [Oscillospiraceae bacterium]|nr:hypothetical protein [Oscillospiraceae bacterium]
MKLQKTSRILEALYLIVAALTILEFLLIRGLFTGPLAVALVLLTSAANVVVHGLQKRPFDALRDLLLALALCMGYYVIAF